MKPQSHRGWWVIAAMLLAGCTGNEPVIGPSYAGVESRGMPQMQRPPQPGMAAAPRAPTPQKFQLPSWPQKWDVNNREPYGVAFGVTQPGPVTVDVQSHGAPVIVALIAAGPQPVQQQSGSGSIRLTHQVTPADVQRGALWKVRIVLAQPGGPSAQAAGTIAVQSPPADMDTLRSQIQAQNTSRPPLDPQSAARVKVTMDASFKAELAKFQQEQTARRGAIAAGLQSLPQMQAARARLQGQVKSRAIESGDAEERISMPGEEDIATRGLINRSQPLTIAPQGTQSFKAIEATLPAPEITWMSGTSGQPGDDLAITGTNFGPKSASSTVTLFYRGFVPNTAQALRYASCPSNPLVAPIKEWNDGLVVVSLPEAPGIIRECPVEIALTRGSDGTTSAPMFGFQLLPAMDIRTLEVPPVEADSYVGRPEFFPVERCVESPDGNKTCSIVAADVTPGWFWKIGVWNPFTHQTDITNIWHVQHAAADLFGYKGNDTFYMTKVLKNEWKTRSAQVQTIDFMGPLPGSSAYLAEIRAGTNSPFISVRTWQEPMTSLIYTIQVTIIGPKGVPHE
jgi:hypothetical protein